MNRLKDATSPYLKQHADNPVDWYPWGDEAFAEAKRANKPILLSIGYSTCHWCHVMAHESFEDADIAKVMNQHYISIKLDREERPDVDAIYMSAVQLLHGHGGWPMTVWLLPDGRPYFAATYLPPKDGQRGVGKGFRSLLLMLRELYDHDQKRVLEAAENLAEGVRENLAASLPQGSDRSNVVRDAVSYYTRRADPVRGGMSGAPKFPSSLPVRLMHAVGERTLAETTLDGMARGGIYDQLAGGFHRYSTDAEWLVPHFEKMLYDNALLVRAYAEGYLLTGKPLYLDVVRETCDYILREMTAPSGLFYSATDADTQTPDGHQEEGWAFSWTFDELGADFAAAYGGTREGNFEGRNVLELVKPEERDRFKAKRAELLALRNTRPQPHLDDKQLSSWNGLMIAGLVHAGDAIDEPRYIAAAKRAAEQVFTRAWRDDHLLRTPGGGPAYLDDYANMIGACLALFSSTAEIQWLTRAEQLCAILDAEFWDPKEGGYFVSSSHHETLIAREKPHYDGAEPCGNATMAEHLVELFDWTQKDHYGERVEAMFRTFGGVLERAPQALAHMVIALAKWQSPSRELAIVGPPSAEMRRISRGTYWLRAVRIEVPEASTLPIPWLADKRAIDGTATAYLCEQQTCQQPVTQPQALLQLVPRR